MKGILTLAFALGVIAVTGVGCLMVLDFVTFDEGVDYLAKALAVIVLLGLASAAIAFVTRSKDSMGE